MGCLREVLVMEGGGHDAALAAPEVTLADQQVVTQSPLKNLAGEVPLDIVLAVGDEDVLDEIGFIEENEVVKKSRPSLKSATKRSRVYTDSWLSRTKRRNWISLAGSASGSGTTPGS